MLANEPEENHTKLHNFSETDTQLNRDPLVSMAEANSNRNMMSETGNTAMSEEGNTNSEANVKDRDSFPLSQATLSLIREKRKARKMLQRNPNSLVLKNLLNQLNRRVGKAVAAEKRKYQKYVYGEQEQ